MLRSPATHKSSGQAQMRSLVGEFTMMSESALQVSLFKRRKNELMF